jgi:hypothetical protein
MDLRGINSKDLLSRLAETSKILPEKKAGFSDAGGEVFLL